MSKMRVQRVLVWPKNLALNNIAEHSSSRILNRIKLLSIAQVWLRKNKYWKILKIFESNVIFIQENCINWTHYVWIWKGYKIHKQEQKCPSFEEWERKKQRIWYHCDILPSWPIKWNFFWMKLCLFRRNCKFSRKTNTKQSKDVNIDLSNRTVNRHRVRSASWLNWNAVLDFTFEKLYTRLSLTHKIDWKRTIYSSEFNKVTRFIWI